MPGTLHPCNVTGFRLKGGAGEHLERFSVYLGVGNVVLHVETSSGADVIQYASSHQVRVMARRLLALADEAEKPRDVLEGVGRDPLAASVAYTDTL